MIHGFTNFIIRLRCVRCYGLGMALYRVHRLPCLGGDYLHEVRCRTCTGSGVVIHNPVAGTNTGAGQARIDRMENDGGVVVNTNRCKRKRRKRDIVPQ
jgi:hypothetical protein